MDATSEWQGCVRRLGKAGGSALFGLHCTPNCLCGRADAAHPWLNISTCVLVLHFPRPGLPSPHQTPSLPCTSNTTHPSPPHLRVSALDVLLHLPTHLPRGEWHQQQLRRRTQHVECAIGGLGAALVPCGWAGNGTGAWVKPYLVRGLLQRKARAWLLRDTARKIALSLEQLSASRRGLGDYKMARWLEAGHHYYITDIIMSLIVLYYRQLHQLPPAHPLAHASACCPQAQRLRARKGHPENATQPYPQPPTLRLLRLSITTGTRAHTPTPYNPSYSKPCRCLDCHWDTY